MRIAARLMKLLRSPSSERDLEAEVEFHIDMRAASYIKNGAAADEAAALARRQFGDVEAIMSAMRSARLGSSTAVVIAIATASVVLSVLWVYIGAGPGRPVVFPNPPGFPMKFVKRVPPPPPPPPTWEEFAAKVNTFGDGSARRRRR